MDVRVGLWRKLSTEELMLLNCGVGEDSWESLDLQGDPISPSFKRPVLGVHWNDWCESWNSNTLATSCEVLTHCQRPWCWEGLGTGGEGDDRGWDCWMASLTWWTWVWVISRNWWWTGRPGVLWFMGSQRVGHDWTIDWTYLTDLGSSSFSVLIFLPLHTVYGVFKARVLKWFAIPSPVDHSLSEPCSIICPFWLTLHGNAHSFIELDKAVIQVIVWLVFFKCGFP